MPIRPKRLKRVKDDIPQHMPRETAAARGYSYRWQQASAGWLRAHPLCVHCEREGRVVAATEVDHIVPHKGDMDIFWDAYGERHPGAGWMSLCKSCHSTKTATEDGGFGRKCAISKP